MAVLVGTSGYSYKQWKGNFYPEQTKDSAMLAFYGSRFSTVEINNTFYRMPKEEVLAKWCSSVPESFRFVLKAPQRLTHQHRLKADCADALSYFLTTASIMGERLGPLLFQLPPNFKLDLSRLLGFLDLLPAGTRAAFEFRHLSWLQDGVFEALRARDMALCIADADDEDPAFAAVRPTATWGYLRLRRAGYDDAAIQMWAAAIKAQSWADAFVFLKHEDEGKGPRLASALLRAL